LKADGAIPTSVSCSLGGSIVAVGFTDEKIRVLDMRMDEKKRQVIELSGGHTDIIRCVKLSPDGMVCLSAGQDCTFRVWDLSSRRCILTHGSETKRT
jgi:WD40 repeat protein